MRTGRLLALAGATMLCSPVVGLVVLRYIFLKDGGLNASLALYPSLIAGLIASLGLLSGMGWLLFSSYRQRSHWPRACGLAAQSDVPQYLHGGDLFLLQLPFCAAQLATVMAMAKLELTAPRAAVASYGAGVACVALCAILPAPRSCWAKEAARHGRCGAIVSLVLCLGSVFAFLFTSYTTASSFGVSLSAQSFYGLALLGGAQFCVVGRNAMARCLIRRNARRLHGAASSAQIAASQNRERKQEAAITRVTVSGDTAAAVGSSVAAAEPGATTAPQNESREAEPDWYGRQADGGEFIEDEDAHLFRGLEEDELTKLDAIFTTPLYLHHPIAVGTVGTFEMAQLGGYLALAPVALLVFYGTNDSAAMIAWLSNDLSMVPMICIGWLALASVLQAPLYSALSLAAPPATVAYVDVLATALAVLLGAFVLTDTQGTAAGTSPELGPPQLAALCIFALAAAISLSTRASAAESAASQQQLLYLADALPNLSAVEVEDLMRVDVSAGHEVFQRLVAEAAYGGTVPPTVPPRWTGDAVSINPTLSRARELEGERELLRFKFPGLDTPPPTPLTQGVQDNAGGLSDPRGPTSDDSQSGGVPQRSESGVSAAGDEPAAGGDDDVTVEDLDGPADGEDPQLLP